MNIITNYKSTTSYGELTYYYFWAMNREKYLPKHKSSFRAVTKELESVRRWDKE